MVFVGRQTREKGFHLLLNAISRFRPGEIGLWLFGKVYEEDLDNKVRSLQTAGFDIRQQGEIPHRELLDRLAQMDVLCLPSTCVEMAPLVVQEAFSTGVPVIGARLGGIADAIRDDANGLLFKPNDADDLTEKIGRLLREPGLLGALKKAAGSSSEVTDIRGAHIQLYQEIQHNHGSDLA
jgi:glycosyltransferase involved in cell wall biosynthesis